MFRSASSPSKRRWRSWPHVPAAVTWKAVRRLSDELGCLPLALAQAAAVIADQQLDYDTYLRRLRDMPVEKLLGRVEAGQYPHGVASAILLSLQNVHSDDETGLCASVMELMSVLSPAGVSRQLLYAWPGSAPSWAQPASQLDLRRSTRR